MKVNKTELAKILDVALPTVDGYIRRGMPAKKNGRAYELDSAACINWLREFQAPTNQDETIKESQRRKAAADATMAEIQLAKEQSLLVYANDVQRIWLDQSIQIRNRMLVIPTRVAPLLEYETNQTKISNIIDNEIRAALIELAESEYSKEEVEEIIGDGRSNAHCQT